MKDQNNSVHEHTHEHDHEHGHCHDHEDNHTSKHDHGHAHHHHYQHLANKNIRLAFFLNTAFVFIEIIGGTLTGSVAILADAVHDFGDTISLGFAWFLQKYSRKEKDQTFTYGYARFSLLAAAISGSVVVFGSIFILIQTIPRFIHPQSPNGPGMLALALLGVVVNGFAAFNLSRGETMNEKVLKWHLLEDALGWVAVLIGSLFIIFFNWAWVDPLIAIVLSVYVLWNVLKTLKQTIYLFLQSVPDTFDVATFESKILALNGVHAIHDLHVWSLDGVSHVLSIHVIVNEHLLDKDLCQIREYIRKLADDMGHYQATIEIERPEDLCPENN